jgi:hypothetical protein
VVRILLLAAAALAGLVWLLDLIIVTDAEEVEEKTARLVELANEATPEAIRAILDEIAVEFSEGYYFTRDRIERELPRYLIKRKVNSIRTGSIDAVWREKEQAFAILLMVHYKVGGQPGSIPLTVYWADRGGEWKITQVLNGWN